MRLGMGLAAALLAVPSSPSVPVCDYEVTVGEGGRELRVEARLPPGEGADLAVAAGLAPFVRDVEAEVGGRWRALPRQGETFRAPSCTRAPCRIRYRFLLAEAARTQGDPETALEYRGVLVAPPSSWLLSPAEEGAGPPRRFRVHTPEGVGFVTGVLPVPGSADTYELGAEDLESPPVAAFGPLQTDRIEVPGATVLLAITPGDLAVTRADLQSWVERAAQSVASFYGAFPIRHALVLVFAGGSGGVGYGITMGNGGASTRLRVGRRTRPEDLTRDWMITHEMVHMALPNLDYPYRWLEEGLATYVEPIARARRGILTPQDLWAGFVEGMAQGLPGQGEGGLDGTHSWGRTYWGGALFCLHADLAIRERTQGQHNLDDALKAVLAAGGNIATRWDLKRVLDTGDQAVGVPVLHELHAQMGLRPFTPDLEGLWKRLGVVVKAGGVSFDETAPGAALRRAITSGPTPRP